MKLFFENMLGLQLQIGLQMTRVFPLSNMKNSGSAFVTERVNLCLSWQSLLSAGNASSDGESACTYLYDVAASMQGSRKTGALLTKIN